MSDRWLTTLRISTFCVSSVELILLLAYFVPIILRVPWNKLTLADFYVYEHNCISDFLFKDTRYRLVLTALLCMQLAICIAFVIELNRPGRFPRQKEWRLFFDTVMVCELVCLCAACVGWVTLLSVYRDENGITEAWHITGSILFMVCIGIYFVLMAFNVAFLYPWKTKGELVVLRLSFILFLVSIFSGAVFAVSFFSKRAPFGWIFEHAALVCFMAAHLLLFVADGLLSSSNKASAPKTAGVAAVKILPTDLAI